MTDLTIRTGTAADRDAIVALQVGIHGEAERWGVRALLADPDVGPERWTVVYDGDRLVSSLSLLTRTLVYRDGSAEVRLPTGQPEYVATEPGYRDRGLVRRQLAEVHRWSAERGDLLQVITGIPYFYRRFGYEYAVTEMLRPLVHPVSKPKGWSTRLARPADTARIVDLDRATQTAADLALERKEAAWERIVRRGAHCPFRTFVAERDGVVGAVATWTSWGEDVAYVDGLSAGDIDAATAVLAAVATDAGGLPVLVWDRPRTAGGVALGRHAADGRAYSLYVRMPDVRAVLEAISPVLSARLARSAFADWDGALPISMYREGVRLHVEHGTVTGVTAERGDPDPGDRHGVGVAPDLVATLVLGRLGALELAARHDDVQLGEHCDLMAVLFPRMEPNTAMEV